MSQESTETGEKHASELLALFERHEINPTTDPERAALVTAAFRAGLDRGIRETILDERATAKLKPWVEEQDQKVAARQHKKAPYYGASGGAYTYEYTPTSLGVVVKVKNEMTGDAIDLTHYEDW